MRRTSRLRTSERLARAARQVSRSLNPSGSNVRQSLVALGINSTTSLAAGAVLGSITDVFERYPGLLVMVPAAVGLRGNVFSALGSRISTSIHTGEYRSSWRSGSVLGDNVVASVAQSLLLSVLLAFAAVGVSRVFHLPGEVSLLDLATISTLGGLGASAIVLAATVLLVTGAVRFEWDLDRIVAPVVSTLGDVVTVPALWVAAMVLGHGSVTVAMQVLAALAALGAVAMVAWSSRDRVRAIMRESIPILTVAIVLSTLAGVVLERQLETFAAYPALLFLQPAFVSSAGALGGVLASTLATGFHLGTAPPTTVPARSVRNEMRLIAALAFVVYAYNGVGADLVAGLFGASSPGMGFMAVAALLGGVGAVAFVLAIAYYGTLASFRLNVDPDTYGVPVVTSSVDFVGTLALVLAVTALPLP